ncbi:MAG: adenylyl-sulfate kinase, partial [Hyphomicrobiaceae bacterium]
VGHVDHGKSTIIGRLIHDTGSLPDGKLEAIKAVSDTRGMPFEWSFLLDALQAERDQGITIDTSQIRFRAPTRDVMLIDAPGHVEFLRNMVTGAAQADAALLVVDAAEGVREQTRRHGYLLHLLGVRRVVVVINKMDRVGWDEGRFRAIEAELGGYLGHLGLVPERFVPVAARDGGNIVARASEGSWHAGPTLIEAIDQFEPSRLARDPTLRLPVQDVYKFDDRRIVCGRVESGAIHVGDDILFQPSGKIAKVATVEVWPARKAGDSLRSVEAGRPAAITLDREIFVERGEVAMPVSAKLSGVRGFEARIFWLGTKPLVVGSRLKLKLGTAEAQARIAAIKTVVDTGSLEKAERSEIERNQVAEIGLELATAVTAELAETGSPLGRFVLEVEGRIAGGGIVLALESDAARKVSSNVTAVESAVTVEERVSAHGHRGAVVWLTGLPSAGKSTVAKGLERRLFDKGRNVVLLDGDTLRTGLNGDLGFTPEDRAENVRRTGEVAALLAKNGIIALVALVSPFAKDRHRAKDTAGPLFHEVYVRASVETCARRDPKGLYARAKAGGIAQFTGVSAGYEPPASPALVIDTEQLTLEQSVDMLERYLDVTVVEIPT